MHDANSRSALLSRSASPDGEEPAPVTHVKEPRQRLRNESIAAFHAAAEEEADDFFVPREKTLEESAREEAESPAAAPTQDDDADADAEKKEKKKKNYILNCGWIDRSSKGVPTYGEVTSRFKKGKAKAQPANDAAGSGGEDETDEEVFDDIVDQRRPLRELVQLQIRTNASAFGLNTIYDKPPYFSR
ncbi:hypothetical protein C8R46DRAFT_1355301 [Mycena filopes]|nr:hypothetical protein C8R46DRAFT_1355301 [Mycena filopes]